MAELVDDDDFPNDFDGLDFDNIPALQAPTISECAPEATVPLALPRTVPPSPVASPVPSTGFNSVEDMDPSFLAAIDALEAHALGEMVQGSESSSREKSDGQPTDAEKVAHSLHHVHEYLMRFLGSFSASRKGKRKAEPPESVDIRTILDGYEADLTCPICCDLLVGAQVSNPCGHTCCGECSYGWSARNKYEPTCAVCRSNLSTRKPLLPNFAVDNLVQQHLQALAKSGRPEWQEKGYKAIEWNKRLESWKEQIAVKALKEKAKEAARLRRRQTRTLYELSEYVAPWGVVVHNADGDEHENDADADDRPRRRMRSRHSNS